MKRSSVGSPLSKRRPPFHYGHPSCCEGLARRLKLVEDELLSSWISRHAEYYRVSPLAMLKHGISDAVSLRAADLRLNAEQGIRLGHIFHLPPADIRRMTHADVPQNAARFLALKPIQICLACAERNEQRDAAAAILRSSLEGWRITCPICGTKRVENLARKTATPSFISHFVYGHLTKRFTDNSC